MTESDKNWMTSEFNRVHQAISGHAIETDRRIQGVEKWICNVEKDTKANSKFIWVITGGLVLIGVIIGILEFSIQ